MMRASAVCHRPGAWLEVLVVACCLAGLLAGPRLARAGETSCILCHSDSDLLEADQVELVTRFREGVHAGAELGCEGCHGGNPDPALAEDPEAAMDPEFAASPFVGVPERTTIPAACGSCHSDPTYMRRFVPDPRVDQEQEYWTSHHGQGLKRGDLRVATCVDCHGVHGILGPASTRSPVHPKHVAETCNRCHGDARLMAGTLARSGRPIPVDQYTRWRASVHAQALLDREDLSAPTCNDCHGNHAATPPGIESVAFVCGHCHAREAELFRRSAKREGFHEHSLLLAEAGDEGCAACHDPESPQSRLGRDVVFSECTTCHGNHAIVRPVLAMLEPEPTTPCRYCHQEAAGADGEGPTTARIREHFLTEQDRLQQEASSQGLDGDDRFDWLIEQVQQLEVHTEPAQDGGRRPRPAFARLYEKLRLGPIHHTLDDPATGGPLREAVIRCTDCHGAQNAPADTSSGRGTARRFVEEITGLSTGIAEGERLLLAAQRGGVHTRGAADEIDQAVEAEIELAVLVHTFSGEDGGELATAASRGRGHAEAARRLADQALAELRYRRRGLAISLGIMLLVLLALAMKIRTVGQ